MSPLRYVKTFRGDLPEVDYLLEFIYVQALFSIQSDDTI